MTEMLTTEEYFKSLLQKDFNRDDILDLSKVNFDPHQFIELINKSEKFEIIHSHDGPISVVLEENEKQIGDFSKMSTDFGKHIDGLYKENPPQFVILYCENEGLGEATTNFYDSKFIASILKACCKADNLIMNYIGRDSKIYPQKFIRQHPITKNDVIMIASRGFIQQDPKSDLSKIANLKELNEVLTLTNAIPPTCSITLKKYDLVLFDNYSFPHSRQSKVTDTKRKLYRIWFNALA